VEALAMTIVKKGRYRGEVVGILKICPDIGFSCRPGTQRHCSTCSCSFVLEEGDELTKIREEVGNGTGIVRLALYTSCPNCHASLFVAGKEVSSAATHVA